VYAVVPYQKQRPNATDEIAPPSRKGYVTGTHILASEIQRLRGYEYMYRKNHKKQIWHKPQPQPYVCSTT
jgi:hypothetical protein